MFHPVYNSKYLNNQGPVYPLQQMVLVWVGETLQLHVVYSHPHFNSSQYSKLVLKTFEYSLNSCSGDHLTVSLCILWMLVASMITVATSSPKSNIQSLPNSEQCVGTSTTIKVALITILFALALHSHFILKSD